MGPLRLWPRCAVHELHGALRLRGDGGEGDDDIAARRHPRRPGHDARTERLMRVMFVAPMAREAKALGADVCGAGPRAGAYVDARLRDGAYDAVVLAGVCGGLDPSLR